MLACRHRRQADRIDIVDGRAEADETGHVRGTGFELVRRIGEGRAFEAHLADHFAAAEERRHRLEMFTAGPKHAGSGRTEHLVAGQGIEVAAERAHVDRQVRRRLRTVDQQRDAATAAFAREPGDRIDRAEHVGDMGHAGQLDVGREQFDEAIDEELARLADRRDLERSAGTRADQLPRHDVGVMFHLGDEDRIAGSEAWQGEAVGDQVGRLGRARGEDDLVARGRIDETRQLVAGRLVGIGRLGAERVHRARHVGIAGPVEAIGRLDHGQGLLRGIGVVEVDQRLAMDLARQQREIGADALDVECRGGLCAVRVVRVARAHAADSLRERGWSGPRSAGRSQTRPMPRAQQGAA